MQEWLSQLLIAVSLLSTLLNGGTHEIPKGEILATSTVQAVVSSTLPEVPPILSKIADCESGERDKYGRAIPGTAKQFNPDGSVVRGEANPQDIGKHQINLHWNGEKAKELGYDLFTEEGNTKMALYLYKTRGTKDWGWSKSCWGRTL